MRKIISVVLAVCLAFVTVGPVVGQEKCLDWIAPGAQPNERSLVETIAALGLSFDMAEKLYEKFRRSVVTDDDVRHVTLASSLDLVKQGRVLAAFKVSKKKFWAKEAVEAMQLPAEIEQGLLLRIDTNAYEVVQVAKGFRIDDFLFAKDRVARCAILNPAARQPQSVVFHLLTVEAGDELETFGHSTICSNVGKLGRKKKVVAPLAVEIIPATTAREANYGATRVVGLPQYRLVVNLFADRDDLMFLNRYRSAKQTPHSETSYRRAVLDFGHDNLVQERRGRPLAGGTFHITVIAGGGMVARERVTTDVTGQAVMRLLTPPEDISTVIVQADSGLVHVIPRGGTLYVPPMDFINKKPTLEVWFIQTKGLD